jgi:tRNA(fMet)-specific endonuclease VapC
MEFTRGNDEFVKVVRLAEERGDIIAVTSVSLFDLLTPIFHKNLSKKERIVRAFLHSVKVLILDSEASEESAIMMAALLKVGKPVNVLDVLIAGIAKVNNAEFLIGHDSDFKEIAKISSLKIQVL